MQGSCSCWRVRGQTAACAGRRTQTPAPHHAIAPAAAISVAVCEALVARLHAGRLLRARCKGHGRGARVRGSPSPSHRVTLTGPNGKRQPRAGGRQGCASARFGPRRAAPLEPRRVRQQRRLLAGRRTPGSLVWKVVGNASDSSRLCSALACAGAPAEAKRCEIAVSGPVAAVLSAKPEFRAYWQEFQGSFFEVGVTGQGLGEDRTRICGIYHTERTRSPSMNAPCRSG